MLYQVIIEPNAKDDLYSIFSYIKTDGSIQSAKKFLGELRKQINSLSYMPNRKNILILYNPYYEENVIAVKRILRGKVNFV